mmetsp:Transcript_67733/g.107302  ORF Transcript_67733/g.107302 Transcript_67733/m.107302 type:complete len:279 (+) Transcript_67733:72-908(+)
MALSRMSRLASFRIRLEPRFQVARSFASSDGSSSSFFSASASLCLGAALGGGAVYASMSSQSKSSMPTGIGLDPSDPVHPYKRTLYIMRGVPASGKSTVAHNILKRHLISNGISGNLDDIASLSRAFMFSTDDFFSPIDEATGAENTVYDMKKIKQNHELNQSRCKIAMDLGITPIIIDNTNTQKWEMRVYAELGQAHGYNIIVKDVMAMQPELTIDVIKERCAGRKAATGKDIPIAAIENMMKRYEKLPSSSAEALPLILEAEPPWVKAKANATATK